jgi:hypothetical protein
MQSKPPTNTKQGTSVILTVDKKHEAKIHQESVNSKQHVHMGVLGTKADTAVRCPKSTRSNTGEASQPRAQQGFINMNITAMSGYR